MVEQSKAVQLKDEGNIFYTQQDYVQAYTKYTEAIAKDQSNAVLYANRAACCLAMKKCWTLETLLPRRRLNYFL
jgi:stress-induced-phosphoprotein 1